MADQPFLLPLDCRGELDTAAPISDLAPGSLVVASDVHARYLGPRRGDLAFTQAMEGPGTAALYDEITLTTGASTYGTSFFFDQQQTELGTKFTLDLWFRISSVAYASAKDEIGLYSLYDGTGLVNVTIMGPNSSDHERVRVQITTVQTIADPMVAMTGATRLSVGSTQAYKHHVRVVRNGASMYLYVDGVLDQSSSGLVATSRVMHDSTSVAVELGRSHDQPDLAITLKGAIFGAVLRDGAFTSAPIEARMPCDPWARNVHHYFLGRNFAFGGAADCYFDASRYGAHARVSGAGYTVTAANDNDAPAHCGVQGLATWTTRTGRTAVSAMAGGILSTAGIS